MSPSSELSRANGQSSLCAQCSVLFSSEGFGQLQSKGHWRHSRLVTFEERNDCRFCYYLWADNFVGDANKHAVNRLRDFVYPRSGAPRRLPAKSSLDSLWVSISAKDPSNGPDATNIEKLWVRIESDAGRLLWQATYPLITIASEDNPGASLTTYRPLTWNGLTPSAVASLKSLLETCRSSHPRCQPSGPKPLPTRVLRIHPGETPGTYKTRLYVTPRTGQMDHYVALSYCWGGPQPVQLTKDTLNGLQRQINGDSLPQTLRDAILATHALGYEFLWVDALCIVQDDTDDKKHEIASMCAIYQNSAVTIAAGTASSVYEGFLSSYSPKNVETSSCTVPARLDDADPDGPEAMVTLQRGHVPQSRHLPLNRRGWTFQEALLPPRLLVFGDVEPILRCRTVDVASGTKSFVLYHYVQMQPQRLVNFVVAGEQDKMEDGIEHVWRIIVEQFTLRELSFQEDRQHAISGVVEFLASSFKDECHYGVWLSCPIACLLWKVSSGRPSISMPSLPTWSWMSVTGEVDLDAMVWFGKPQATVEWDDSDTTRQRMYLTCRVLTQQEAVPHLIESWPDLISGEDEDDDEGKLKGQRYYLVLGRETSNRTLALIATDEGNLVYHRCGLAELITQNSWIGMPQTRIILE